MKRIYPPMPRCVCSVCLVFKRSYGKDICFSCYRKENRKKLEAAGIEFPKRLGRPPVKRWAFVLLEDAMRKAT